jgi:hypothetical protein
MSYCLRAREERASLAPLTPSQLQYLGCIAKFAWVEIGPDQDCDDWRHDEVRKVTGRGRLKECQDQHFLPLKAHFLDICGHSEASFKAAFKSIDEPRARALHALRKEAKAAEDVMPRAMDYAAGMIRNISGGSIDDAPRNLIWRATFAIRRKAQKLRREKKGGESAGDVMSRVLGEKPKVEKKARTRRYSGGPF